MLLTIGLAAWLGLAKPTPTPRYDDKVRASCEREVAFTSDPERRKVLCCGPCLQYMGAGTQCQSIDCPGRPAIPDPFKKGGNP